MTEECTLSSGKVSPGGFPRNSAFMITDRHDMTSACTVDVKQQIKQKQRNIHKYEDTQFFHLMLFLFSKIVFCGVQKQSIKLINMTVEIMYVWLIVSSVAKNQNPVNFSW